MTYDKPSTAAMRRPRRGIALLLLGTSLIAAPSAHAASVTWTGLGSTSWDNAASWSPNAPVDGDDVTIQQTGTSAPSNYNVNLTVHSLTLETSTDAGSLASGYVVNNAGSSTFGLQSGGSIVDNAANAVADQLNMGIALNGPATISLSSGATGLIIGGGITGTGGLTVTNDSAAGLLQFTASNTYTGGTTITAGTLQLGKGGTTGSIVGDVVDNGTLQFDRSDSVTFDGVISGSGIVNQIGTGVVTLTGVNTYTGGTNINGGTLSISSDANLGTGAIAMATGTALQTTASGTFTHDAFVTGEATFRVTSATTAVWSGLIADGGGAGTVVVGGGGIFNPTDTANSYSGGTQVIGGSTLRIDNDGELGAGSGALTLGDATTSGILNVAANLTLAPTRAVVLEAGDGRIDTDSAVVFEIGQAISGAGGLTVTGDGTLVLSNTNTYTGGTIITGGNLQLGNGVSAGSVAGNITDNGALTFMEGGSMSFGGVIAGMGTLTQNDSTGGTLTLTGNNTYTGLTTITAGTLQIGDGGTTGAIAGNVVDNTSLVFDRSNFLIFGGAVSGTGQLVDEGTPTSTLFLTGDSTYTGGTTIDSGTLELGDGHFTGSIIGDVSVANGATFAFNRANTLTFNGIISGTGAVKQVGSGTTILTGDQTYTGGTTITGGTLQLGDGHTNGSILGDVTDNGRLAINRSDDLTLAIVVSGTGAFEQRGTNVVTLIGANTYIGGTLISPGGTLQIGDGTTLGSIMGNVLDAGVLAFDHADDVVFAGAISGTGVLNQIGTGALILTGNNTFSGLTTVNTGTLQIGNGGTSGILTGDIADGTMVTFDRSDASSYVGAISGAGSLVQLGSGTTMLAGDSTYSGGTTITAGTLELGNGGATGSIPGDVTDNGVFAFNRSSAFAFDGIISGSGGVTQLGSGTTTLTAVETYTGATIVSGGTLLVNGSIVSDTTVNGGTFGGTGTVGDIIVAAGGNLAPGPSGSVGTLNVLGDVTFSPSSTFTFDTTPTTFDLLTVSGTASLNGTLVLHPTGSPFTLNQKITLIDATGELSGTFTNVSLASSFGGFIPVLSYDAHHAFLNLVLETITPLLPADASENEKQVALAADVAIATFGTSAFAPFDTLPASAIGPALSQMSGEEAVGAKRAAMDSANTFLANLLDPSVGGRGGVGSGGSADRLTAGAHYARLAYNGSNDGMPYSATAGRSGSLWGAFSGARSETDADAVLGTHHTNMTDYAGAMGLDYRPANGGGALGVALGFGQETWDLAADMGKGRAQSFEIGAYYSRRLYRTYFDLAGSYGRHDITLDRMLDFGGPNTYRATFHASTVSGRMEIGHIFPLGIGRLTPFLGFQVHDVSTPAYAETTLTGSPSFALSYASKTHLDYTSELGTGWNTILAADSDSQTDLHARLGWLHDFKTEIWDTASFTAFPGSDFVVNGAAPSANAAHVALGIEHDTEALAFTLTGDGVISEASRGYGGTASVSYRW